MSKFQKGDMLVVLQSSDRNNVGRVGAVTDITDGDRYTLDTMPYLAFREDCLRRARGADLIREERGRQIIREGYDASHDREHSVREFVLASVAYMLSSIGEEGEARKYWPWDEAAFKPKDNKSDMIRGGALAAAAIDRLQYEQE